MNIRGFFSTKGRSYCRVRFFAVLLRPNTGGDRFVRLQPRRIKKMLKMNYLFTSESVSEGHPDKVADQISDSILDEFLRQDPESKVAVETFCTAGLVIVGGEVHSDNAYVDIQKTVHDTVARIGYTKSEYGFDCNCGVMSIIQGAFAWRCVQPH